MNTIADKILNKKTYKKYGLHWRSHFFKRMKENPKPDMDTDILMMASNYLAGYIPMKSNELFTRIYLAIKHAKKEKLGWASVGLGLNLNLIELLFHEDSIFIFYSVPDYKGEKSLLIKMPLSTDKK